MRVRESMSGGEERGGERRCRKEREEGGSGVVRVFFFNCTAVCGLLCVLFVGSVRCVFGTGLGIC